MCKIKIWLKKPEEIFNPPEFGVINKNLEINFAEFGSGNLLFYIRFFQHLIKAI